MGIWVKVNEIGGKVSEGISRVAAIGIAKFLAFTVAAMMALPGLMAFAEDAGGTSGSTTGTSTASQFKDAKDVADAHLQVGDLAKEAYKVATTNISTTVVYIVLLAAVGLAIAWVLKIFRFGKRE